MNSSHKVDSSDEDDDEDDDDLVILDAAPLQSISQGGDRARRTGRRQEDEDEDVIVSAASPSKLGFRPTALLADRTTGGVDKRSVIAAATTTARRGMDDGIPLGDGTKGAFCATAAEAGCLVDDGSSSDNSTSTGRAEEEVEDGASGASGDNDDLPSLADSLVSLSSLRCKPPSTSRAAPQEAGRSGLGRSVAGKSSARQQRQTGALTRSAAAAELDSEDSSPTSKVKRRALDSDDRATSAEADAGDDTRDSQVDRRRTSRQDSTDACNRGKRGRALGQSERRQRELEQLADKERKRQEKAARKAEKTARLETEKQLKQAGRQANKVKSIEEALREVVVLVDLGLEACVGTSLVASLLERLDAQGSPVARQELELPGCLAFVRNVERFDFPVALQSQRSSSLSAPLPLNPAAVSGGSTHRFTAASVQEREKDSVWLVDADRLALFLQLGRAQELVVDRICSLRAAAHLRTTLVVCGMGGFAKKMRRFYQSQRRAAMQQTDMGGSSSAATLVQSTVDELLLGQLRRLGESAHGDARLANDARVCQDAHRALKDACSGSAPMAGQEEIEQFGLEIALEHGIQVMYAKDDDEAADTLCKFVKAVASAPYSAFSREFSFDTVSAKRSGQESAGTWQTMLEQIQGVSATVAEGIVTKYPSLVSLLRAYDACQDDRAKDELLVGIPCTRNGVDFHKSIGSVISKRVRQVFNSVDPHLVVGKGKAVSE